MFNSSVYTHLQTSIGQKVCAQGKYGILQYVGIVHCSDGVWCGIELDKATGDYDGSIYDVRYFTCESNHGIFVPAEEVCVMNENSDESNILANYNKMFNEPEISETNDSVDLDLQDINESYTFSIDFKKKCTLSVIPEENSERSESEESDESLGIIPDILKDSPSWDNFDLLDEIKKPEINSNITVTLPNSSIKDLILNGQKILSQSNTESPIQNNSFPECASTPKHESIISDSDDSILDLIDFSELEDNNGILNIEKWETSQIEHDLTGKTQIDQESIHSLKSNEIFKDLSMSQCMENTAENLLNITLTYPRKPERSSSDPADIIPDLINFSELQVNKSVLKTEKQKISEIQRDLAGNVYVEKSIHSLKPSEILKDLNISEYMENTKNLLNMTVRYPRDSEENIEEGNLGDSGEHLDIISDLLKDSTSWDNLMNETKKPNITVNLSNNDINQLVFDGQKILSEPNTEVLTSPVCLISNAPVLCDKNIDSPIQTDNFPKCASTPKHEINFSDLDDDNIDLILPEFQGDKCILKTEKWEKSQMEHVVQESYFKPNESFKELNILEYGENTEENLLNITLTFPRESERNNSKPCLDGESRFQNSQSISVSHDTDLLNITYEKIDKSSDLRMDKTSQNSENLTNIKENIKPISFATKNEDKQNRGILLTQELSVKEKKKFEKKSNLRKSVSYLNRSNMNIDENKQVRRNSLSSNIDTKPKINTSKTTSNLRKSVSYLNRSNKNIDENKQLRRNSLLGNIDAKPKINTPKTTSNLRKSVSYLNRSNMNIDENKQLRRNSLSGNIDTKPKINASKTVLPRISLSSNLSVRCTTKKSSLKSSFKIQGGSIDIKKNVCEQSSKPESLICSIEETQPMSKINLKKSQKSLLNETVNLSLPPIDAGKTVVKKSRASINLFSSTKNDSALCGIPLYEKKSQATCSKTRSPSKATRKQSSLPVTGQTQASHELNVATSLIRNLMKPSTIDAQTLIKKEKTFTRSLGTHAMEKNACSTAASKGDFKFSVKQHSTIPVHASLHNASTKASSIPKSRIPSAVRSKLPQNVKSTDGVSPTPECSNKQNVREKSHISMIPRKLDGTAIHKGKNPFDYKK